MIHYSKWNTDCVPSEDQFDRIHSRLRRLEHIVQNDAATCGLEDTPNSVETLPDDSFYRGDSSFEVHSGATGQVLRDALNDHKSPIARKGSPTSLGPLQSFSHASKACSHNSFEHNLSMPPRDLVLKAVRLIKGKISDKNKEKLC